MKRAILCVAMATSAAAAAGEPPAFLAGDWCAVSGERRFEERWTAPADGRMHALARSFRGHRLTGFEFLRIETEDDALTYLAQPGGGAPVPFRESERGEARIVFANPAHDYPTRITYRRVETGIEAEISGPNGDKRQRWRLARLAN